MVIRSPRTRQAVRGYHVVANQGIGTVSKASQDPLTRATIKGNVKALALLKMGTFVTPSGAGARGCAPFGAGGAGSEGGGTVGT
jgi:hypothetical protein